MHFYLSGYEWETGGDFPYWRAPLKTRAQLDLRNLGQMGQAGGTPQGFGFFALPVKDNNLDHYLGDDLSKFVGAAGRTKVENVFSLSAGSITADSIGKILAQLLTEQGDPEGISRFKPLMSRELHAGGKIWSVKKRRDNPIWWERWLNVKRMDYRRMKAEATDEHYRKWLDYTSRKNNVSFELLLPPEAKGDTPLPHSTTLQDTFVEGLDTALESHTATGPNSGFSWSVGNGDGHTVIAATNDVSPDSSSVHNYSRADSDLSGDDHFSEVDITNSTTARTAVVCTRFAAAAFTNYMHELARSGANDNDSAIYKWLTGSATLINQYTNSVADPSGLTIKLEVDGSNLIPSVAGTPLTTQTDPSITGNTRCGIGGFGNEPVFDNFKCEDLAVGVTIPIFEHHYRSMT